MINYTHTGFYSGTIFSRNPVSEWIGRYEKTDFLQGVSVAHLKRPATFSFLVYDSVLRIHHHHRPPPPKEKTNG